MIEAMIAGVSVLVGLMLLFFASRSNPQRVSLVQDSCVELGTAEEEQPGLEEKIRIAINAAQSKAEIANVIGRLKLERKGIRLRRKEINTYQGQIRSVHTDRVRRQIPMLRGGGGFGQTVRTLQSLARANRRHELAVHLAPGTITLSEIDEIIAIFDRGILEAERKRLSFGV